MKIKDKSVFAIFLLTPLAIGSISSLLSGNARGYDDLILPSFAPPAALFPIVWAVLYLLMGISAYLIYETEDPKKQKALFLYGLQLFFNFTWSILFFGFSQYFLAFLWLLELLFILTLMIYYFYQISPLAAILQIPYFLWCVFAAILNFAVYKMN